MMKKLLGIFALVVLCTACEQDIEKEYVTVPALRESEIYRRDLVADYAEKYGDAHNDIASAYFERGNNILNTDPSKAIYYIKRAITLRPSFNYYEKLGEVCLEKKQYREADAVYCFLTGNYEYDAGTKKRKYYFEEPGEDIYYKAILAGLLNNGYVNTYLLYSMEEEGISKSRVKERLLKDPLFPFKAESIKSKEVQLCFMSEEECAEYVKRPEAFADFLGSIDSCISFEIDKNRVSRFAYGRDSESLSDEEGMISYSWYFRNFLPEIIADDQGWMDYNLLHRIRINSNITAVVYSVDSSERACPREMREITFRLATYGADGKLIDSKTIACQKGYLLTTCSFLINDITMKSYTREWKRPYVKTEFDNKVESITEGEISRYFIDMDGKILPQSAIPQVIPVDDIGVDAGTSQQG